MLWTIFVVLLVLWLLGVVSSYTLGCFIHVLLVIAIVVVLIRVDPGSPPRLSRPAPQYVARPPERS
jgi:uncharacterized protein DUF5670